MRQFLLFILALCTCLLWGCQQSNKDGNEPETNVQHGSIGDIICVNGYYYMITNNYRPYTVELEKEGFLGSSNSPMRMVNAALKSDAYTGNVIIPSKVEYDGVDFSVTSIGDGAFYNKSVKSVYIPGCVESVGFNAFRMCYDMEEITLCYGIKRIGSYAFCDCRKCTSLTLPGSVEQMGTGAFSGCYYWTRLNIENGVKEIGYGAFNRRNYPTTTSYVYSYSIEPPVIASRGDDCEAFTIVNCELYVPKGTLLKYKNAAGWRNFSTIHEMN